VTMRNPCITVISVGWEEKVASGGGNYGVRQSRGGVFVLLSHRWGQWSPLWGEVKKETSGMGGCWGNLGQNKKGGK